MEVVHVPVDDLSPNPWNVNRMTKVMRQKLRAYIKREGLVEPIVVRPYPDDDGHYQILGGFHRWSICKDELDYEYVPCVVVEGLDDKRAKILSLNLNSMSGEPVPSLLSGLLNDLHQGLPMADLAATLPWEQAEIQDFMSLMRVPEGFGDDLEEEASDVDDRAPNVVTVVLDNEQHALWLEALDIASADVGKCRNPKAKAVELMARQFVAGKEGVPSDAA